MRICRYMTEKEKRYTCILIQKYRVQRPLGSPCKRKNWGLRREGLLITIGEVRDQAN
jgi:hypothetical protein